MADEADRERDNDIADAEIVEEGADRIGEQSSSTTAALAPLPPMTALDITRPIAGVEDVRAAFEQYEQLRRTIVVKADITNIQGKEFVNKSGWRKLAVVMGVSGQIVSRDYQRDAQGRVMSAEVVMRAVAPNGRFMEGLGACDLHERCCPKAFSEDAVCRDSRSKHHHCIAGCDGYNHFSKPQHDIPATAQTRALNRACSDLFGFGEVSAEEVTDRDEAAEKVDIDSLVHALNSVEASQRGPAKHAFVQKFGMPAELKKGQVDAAVRFVRSLGVEVGKVPDPAAGAAAPASDEPHAEDQATSADVAHPSPDAGAPEGDADSEPSGSAGGAEEQGSGLVAPPANSAPPKPSTPQQRQTLGIRFKELEANGIILEGDKAEIVGILSLGRTTTTTQITFEEAVKLVALAHMLEGGSIVVVDDPAGGRTLHAKGQPGTSFLATLPQPVAEVL